MKKLIAVALLFSLLSCSKKEEVTEEKSGGLSEVISGVKNYSDLASSMDDVTKNVDKLKALKPLNNEELKAILPENLMGLKRTEMSVGDVSMMNLSSAESKYSDENGKEIRLQIMDGAGETGSAMITIMMMTLSGEREKTTATGFEKTTTINGMKAFVSETNNGEQTDSEIQTVIKDRYMITLNGRQMTFADLEKVLGEINLSSLK